MKTTNDELLIGSLAGAAKTDCGSGIMKRLRKTFKKICRKQRNLQIINQQGGSINFYVIDSNKESIENLIMENNNFLTQRCYE